MLLSVWLLAIACHALSFPFVSQDEGVRAIVRDLHSESVEKRDEAASKLKLIGTSALPLLAEAAQDPDREVSGRAQRLIRVIQVREKLSSALLKDYPGIDDRLASGDDKVWTTVLIEILTSRRRQPKRHTSANADLVPLLVPAVKGSSPGDFDRILEWAQVERVKEAASPFSELLSDDRTRVRLKSLGLLVSLEADDFVPEILKYVDDQNEDMRVSVVLALDSLGKPEVVESVILRVVTDASVRVRCAALFSMRARRSAKTLSAVIGALSDPAPECRVEAINALCKFNVKEGNQKIAQRLDDPSPDVRRYAASAIGELGDRSQVEKLFGMLGDPSPEVRRSVWDALAELAPKETVAEARKALGDQDPEVQLKALIVLSVANDRDSLPVIVGFLRNRHPMLKWHATLLLLSWREPACIPNVLEGLAPIAELNAFRSPEMWKRLLTKEGAVVGEFSRLKWLETVAGEAGATLQWGGGESSSDAKWSAACKSMPVKGDSLLGILMKALGGLEVEFILEGAAIRILPRKEAERHWRDWWETQQHGK